MRRLRFKLAAAVVATLVASPVAAWAADGDLDASFGSGGKVTTAIGTDAYAAGVVVDSAGRLVVSGSRSNGSNYDFAVARYLPNGSLDPSFGSGGVATAPVGPGDDFGDKLAIDSQGRIVVGGAANNGTNDDFAVARFLPNGTLDTSFNGTGTEMTPIGSGDDEGGLLALDSQGRIVLGGYASNGTNEDFALARYLTNGNLDTTFNGTGKLIQPIGASDDFGQAIAIDSQDRILLGGGIRGGPPSHVDFGVARFTTGGALDTTFNGTGFTVFHAGSGNNDQIKSMAIDSQGRIVVAGGSMTSGGREDFAVGRLLSNGTMDTSFNGTGIATASFAGSSEAHAVAIDPVGRIVTAGTTHVDPSPSSKSQFGLARFTPNGTLDPSFGAGGKVMTGFNGTGAGDSANAVAIDSRDRIVAAGFARNPANTGADVALARYLGDGLAPAVTITSGPAEGAFTKDSTPSFGFTVDDSTATSACAFDSAASAACSSPVTPSARLPDGQHTLTVSATDPAGNVGSAQRSFTVDTKAPALKIKGKSEIKTARKRARARFKLKASEPATFKCKVDRKKAKRCGARYRTPKLKPGKHKLKVIATDRAGNKTAKAKRFQIVHR